MLLIIAESSSKNEEYSLGKVLRLASIVSKKSDTHFIIEGSGDIPALFKGTGFKYSVESKPREVFKESISLVVFYKEDFSKSDKKILSYAKKRGITTIKFSYRRLESDNCDIVINPTIFSGLPFQNEQKKISGPEYSILHNKYIHFFNIDRKYKKKLKNTLISIGNEFPYRELRKLSEILLNFNYNVKIIPGKNFKKYNRKTLKRIYPNLKISGTPESYARSFFEADLAICDPVTCADKAAATGTPAIYIPQSDIGKTIAESYEEKGAGIIFKRWRKDNYSEIIELLKFFSLEKRIEIGKIGKTLVDGKGIYRIAELLKIHLNP